MNLVIGIRGVMATVGTIDNEVGTRERAALVTFGCVAMS